MSLISIRRLALARLAVFCLGTSALTLPALAASFSVGGGTITTTQADASSDSTGTGGPFALQANTVSAGDALTITGIGITNTSHAPNGRALDVGGLLASAGSYSVVMHGSTLAGDTGFGTGGAGAWFQSVGGLVSFDSTGGAANTISGKQGLAVINNTGNGSVSIKTGADSITSSSGEAIYGVAQGTGTISIDFAGATVNSGSLYGISASGGNGLITLGGLNGGLSGTINALSGSGIFTTSTGNQIITLASSGVINALNGMTLGGASTITVDSFGTINASNNAISGASLVTLESGSKTIGKVLGSSANETFNIVAGADISGATFDGVGGSDTLNLTGSGNGTFNLASASNISSFQKMGNGTWTVTGSQSGSANWTVAGGALQVGNGGTTGSLTGNVLDNGNLVFNRSDAFIYAGNISGTGSVSQSGSGTLVLTGANNYTGGTIISAGTLQLGTPTTTGSLTGDVLNNAKLEFDRSDTYTFAGNISGSGIVLVAGGGTVILTGNNSYTGDTTVFINANLQAGNGGTVGSLANGLIHVGGGTVTVDRSNSYTFSGSITNAVDGTGLLGSVAVIGSGTTIFAGTNTYTGRTTVSAGTLNVTGSIASSSVSIASSATLSGTGKVGTTTVASGGTLAPGAGTTPGTLTISGNLTLASGADFADAVTPTAASLASVSGAASINGAVVTSITPGAYSFGQRFPILTATGGVSGTFTPLLGIPATLKGQLSYDANNVYLNLSPILLAPSLASNTTTNQHNVVAAIDAAVTSGAAAPSGGFNALYGLSGTSLNSAIDQISGRAGPNVSNAVGQSFLSFLAITAEGGAGDAGGYAPGSAYGAATAPHRAQLDAGQTRVWGGAYGGHAGLSGDAASGAAALSAGNVGLIGGADMQFGNGILAGVTLDWGREHFNSGNGSGISTDYAFGLYGRYDVSPAYVTAAFGYGWHQITTLRVVTVSGTDVLQGKQNADDFGGRIEAGWRMPLDDNYTIAPYGAFAGESFESPAYAETALSGASTFALSYAAHASTLGRTELGAHLDRTYDLGNDELTADVKAAWAHQLDDQPFTQASFENLATTGFEVLGVRPARDTALLGADLELQYRSGLFLSLRGEGQFGAGTTILEGLGSFGLRW
jgi:fibronectin-binding autotransporter adhesin